MHIIKDNSSFRIAWDSFLLLLILISCILIPYQFVFIHEVSWGSSYVIYLIDIIFLLDIWLNFNTSYRSHGVEIFSRKKLYRHYARTSFPMDLVANLPFDLLLLLFSSDLTVMNVPVVLWLRLFRLLRVLRLFKILKRWERHIWSNAGYLRIVRFLTTILIVIHWIACFWFFSAFASGFPVDSWVVIEEIQEEEHADQYIRSLYWTITTMTTVGYGDISPHRSVEYIFAMVVMFLGASMYAFIIGNVASLFSNFDAAKVQYRNRMEAITQYLQYRKVPDDLNAKVNNYYEYMWNRRRGIDEKQMLIDLPGPLRLEILLHLTQDLLGNVPLFKYCSGSLRNKLLESLSPHTFPPNVLVVQEGELGQELFFISKGKLEVISGDGKTTHAIFEEGEYFGDLAFFMKENRTASVRTLTYCEVFKLEAQDFNQIKNDYPEFIDVVRKMSAERTEKTTNLILDGIIL